MRKKQVLVIGSSDENRYRAECRVIGNFIARNGWVLITGGRGGIMESVSRGAAEEGGVVVGILPESDLDGANEYCSIVVATGMGHARNAINVLSADIVVAVGGKAGTLSELAYAWMYGKPVVCCVFADGWSSMLPEMRIDDRESSRIFIAATAEDACEHLRNFFT